MIAVLTKMLSRSPYKNIKSLYDYDHDLVAVLFIRTAIMITVLIKMLCFLVFIGLRP